MSDHIYQAIWNEDADRFSVSTRNVDGDWTDMTADILLDEQVKAKGSRQIDLAANPLFARVDFDKMAASDLYQSFIRLLDNYAVHFRDPETISPAERDEIEGFLDLVIASRPMQIAFEHISAELVRDMSSRRFQKRASKRPRSSKRGSERSRLLTARRFVAGKKAPRRSSKVRFWCLPP